MPLFLPTFKNAFLLSIQKGTFIKKTILTTLSLFSSLFCSLKDIPTDKIIKQEQQKLAHLNCTQPKIIAIYGGLGTLSERFLKEEINKLKNIFPAVNYIIVDKRNVEQFPLGLADKAYYTFVQERMHTIALPWLHKDNYLASYYERDDFDTLFKEGKIHIDGAILAIPFDHYELAHLMATHHKYVFVEKPLDTPEKLEAFKELFKNYPEYIFAVDFLMNADTLEVALKNSKNILGIDIIKELGTIKVVAAREVESWGIEDEQDNTNSFRQWVRNPQLGGALLDSGTHTFAMLAKTMHYLGYDLADAQLQEGKRFIYSRDGKKPKPKSLETYAQATFTLDGIIINADMGKGINDTFYGVYIEGNGSLNSILISTGTETREAFIDLQFSNGSQQTFVFKNLGLGYRKEITDFLLTIYNKKELLLSDSLEKRFAFTSSSLTLIKQLQKMPLYEHNFKSVPPKARLEHITTPSYVPYKEGKGLWD